MKILHIIKSMINNSGVSVFTGEVACYQSATGHDVRIWCRGHPDYPVGGARCDVVKAFPRKFDADIVHVEALWDLYCLKAILHCVRDRVPFVVSPHGCLMPRVFTKGRLKKWICWWLLLRPLLKKASVIHCTSDAEKAACQRLGLSGPFLVVPLGVHLSALEVSRKKSFGRRTLLFLGRLSEEKGLINLLDAWKSLNHREWTLKIAGPDWRNYRSKLDDKVATEQISDVEFLGLVQGETKDWIYREADVFVLPSPMENFSKVVLDALAYGVPTVATKGTPWEELESERCGWWIDQGVEPLKVALEKSMELSDDERYVMGMNGRRLAERKYQWSKIARELTEWYQKIIKECECRESVL